MEKLDFYFVPVLPAAVISILICRHRLARGKQVSWESLTIGPILGALLAILALAYIESDADFFIFTARYWHSRRADPLGVLFEFFIVPAAVALLPSLGIGMYYQRLPKWRLFAVGLAFIALAFFVTAFTLIRLGRFVDRNDSYLVKAELTALEQRIETFRQLHGRLPSNQEGLGVLFEHSTEDRHSWNLSRKRVPRDPWGGDYVYVYPGKHNPHDYDLYTPGPDGRLGGYDDMGNWDFAESASVSPTPDQALRQTSE